METVFRAAARLALPDFSARFTIWVAPSGWLSRHPAGQLRRGTGALDE